MFYQRYSSPRIWALSDPADPQQESPLLFKPQFPLQVKGPESGVQFPLADLRNVCAECKSFGRRLIVLSQGAGLGAPWPLAVPPAGCRPAGGPGFLDVHLDLIKALIRTGARFPRPSGAPPCRAHLQTEFRSHRSGPPSKAGPWGPRGANSRAERKLLFPLLLLLTPPVQSGLPAAGCGAAGPGDAHRLRNSVNKSDGNFSEASDMRPLGGSAEWRGRRGRSAASPLHLYMLHIYRSGGGSLCWVFESNLQTSLKSPGNLFEESWKPV
ncbi:hypothetical protein PBY51_015555 [Eleginops maclovinus]|uniref:Uncharacterized protein n=1 Tax=Eleginops maclovinus TaxID=56733 RepID=A0AAN7XJ27_ELEMC|nr:hypothetical protein PBY51_015555 [Eleginops maclovinus]